MVEAIIIFGADNVWTRELNRKNKYYVHGTLLFLATTCIAVGVALEVNSKIKNNYSHFQSKHAITGKDIIKICLPASNNLFLF